MAKSSGGRDSLMRNWWFLGGVAAAVVAVLFVGTAFVVNATRTQPETISPNAMIVPQQTSPAATSTGLDLDRIRSAIFIGDSWVYGAVSEPATDGFAYRTGRLMGWNTEVHGWGSVGYIDRGVDSGGNYAERWSRVQPGINPDLVVIEGSLNDDEYTPNDIREAAGQFLAQVRGQFPSAQVLIIGPASPSQQWRKSLPDINYELAALARAQSVPFVNPGPWLSTANYAEYVDPASPHLNTAGHEYYADQLVAAMKGETATN